MSEEYRIVLDCKRMMDNGAEANQYRMGTLRWAMWHALMNLEVGDSLVVERGIGMYGQPLRREAMRVAAIQTSQHHGRAVTTFYEDDESAVGIYRVA